jgi:hypothetical protein
MAIVAMVNSTKPAKNVSGITCSHLISEDLTLGNESTTIDHMQSQGEFEWSEAEQGLILGSFFWGYVVRIHKKRTR